jgi:hypothetical protein
MAEKFGTDFVNDMIDRGRRELGGVMYPDSNIAQPMYPLRGSIGISKEAESKETFEDLHPVDIGPPEPNKDDRDRGMDRE